jgi:hypothetical protein
MAEGKPPARKMTARDKVGALAALLFGFGMVSFWFGQSVPWGFQQVGGLIAAVLGIVLMFVRLWLPRK